MDQDLALESVRHGAQDFLCKNDLSGAQLSRAIAIARERKRTEARLAELAGTDSLTGLANRSTLRTKLATALARAARGRLSFAVAFLDLDSFKQINDTHGHDAGDWLLHEVARRLLSAVRPYDLVARAGGDEFVLLLEDIADEAGARDVLSRITALLKVPVALEDTELVVSASIGVALYPEAGVTVDELLKSADRAMYAAKRSADHQPQVARVEPRP
jgi:diguanylate cyclase